MRIGIDLGGTKIEAVALDSAGGVVARHRAPTPRGSYTGVLDEIVRLVSVIESETGGVCTVGVGTPGAISPSTGVIKNANSTVLNGENSMLIYPSGWLGRFAFTMTPIVSHCPRPRMVRDARHGLFLGLSWGPGPAREWWSMVSYWSAQMPLPVSGGTIRCRGRGRANCRDRCVTAGTPAV